MHTIRKQVFVANMKANIVFGSYNQGILRPMCVFELVIKVSFLYLDICVELQKEKPMEYTCLKKK